MLWKGHFIFGFLLFFILGYFFLGSSIFEIFFLSFIAGFSALLPDLDHELSKSKKWLDRLFPIFSFALAFVYLQEWYSALIIAILLSGAYFIIYTFLKPKHRGITHSLLALLVLSVISYFISPNLSYAFFIGYLSHLIGDKKITFV